MKGFESVPPWIALPAALFVVLGATLTLLGAWGFLREGRFYDRVHVTTLGASWGAAGILLASMLLSSWGAGRPVVHELVLGVFVIVTGPVTLVLLVRAALARDRAAAVPGTPPAPTRGVEAVPDTGSGAVAGAD